MRPSFSTEIGRMRADEMRLRAERYRKAAAVAKKTDDEETPVVTERRRSFSLRRIFALATGVMVLTVAMAGTALANVAPPPGWGESQAGMVDVPASTPVVTPMDVTPFLVAAAVVLVTLGTAWFVRQLREPRVA